MTVAGDVTVINTLSIKNGANAPIARGGDICDAWINTANHTTRDALPTAVATLGTLVRTLNDGVVWEVVSVGPVVYAPWSGSGGVTSFKARTGAVVPAPGDYAASQIDNDSATVSGTRVSNALDNLKSLALGLVTGVSSVFGRTGAIVAAFGDYAASQIANDSSVAGLGVKGALNTLLGLLGAGPAPLNANLYVDPTFSGTSTGSQSNPFSSHTAAIAAAVSAGLSTARFVQAPGTNSTENVALPSTGNWEIASDFTGSGRDVATVITKITGNVSCTSANLVLTNVWITGNITGNATNTVSGQTLTLKNTLVSGAVTLSGSVGAFWLTFLNGDMAWPNGNVGCVLTGAVSIVGNIAAFNAYFGSTISVTSVNRFINCRLNGNVTVAGPSDQLVMLGCTWPNNPLTITGAGTTGVVMDGYTASSKFTLTGCVLNLRNAVTPFRATFYVDPLFVTPSEGGGGGTGGSVGTQSNPFASIAAAIAAAPSTGALIILAPNANTTENVTLPTTGNWEIRCETVGRATITGNVVCSAAVQTRCQLTNIVVTGAVSGLASNPTANAANFLVLTNSQVLGAVTMTQSSNGFWIALLRGTTTNFFSLGGAIVGACTVQGQLFASNWAFGGAITTNSIGKLDFCSQPGGASLITLTGGGSLSFQDSSFATAPTFVGGPVAMDGYTWARAGVFSLTSGATATLVSAVNPSQITAGGAVNGNLMGFSGGVWGPVAGLTNVMTRTFYVDGAALVGGNGSQVAPFQTVQQAVTAGGATSGVVVINIAPGTYSGAITFPATTGGSFVLQSMTASSGRYPVTISGAVTLSLSTDVTVSGVNVSGAVTTTGTPSGGTYFVLRESLLSGTVTDSTGFLNVIGIGNAISRFNAYGATVIAGVVNIRARLVLEKCVVQTSFTCGSLEADDSDFVAGAFTATNVANVISGFAGNFRGECTFGAGWTFTATAAKTLTFQDPSSKLHWDVAAPTVTNGNAIVLDYALGVSGVSSFKTRTGAVVPAANDYSATQINNDSGEPGITVANCLQTIFALFAALPSTILPADVDSTAAGTGTSSNWAREDHKHKFVARAGDYLASQITNNSATVSGSTVAAALDALKALIAASVTGVSSVYGRTGAVVAVLNDYVASLVGNDSSVSGSTVKDALNNLLASLAAVLTSSAPVNVTNAAAVVGTATTAARADHKHNVTVAAAVSVGAANAQGSASSLALSDHTHAVTDLALAGSAQGDVPFRNATNWVRLAAGIARQFLMTSGGGANPAWATPQASDIHNDSSAQGGTTKDALNSLLLEYSGIVNVLASFTLTSGNVDFLYEVNVGSAVVCTIPTTAASGIPIGARFSVLLRAAGSILNFAGAGGVTVHNVGVVPETRYTLFHFDCIGTDEWEVTWNVTNSGDLDDSSSVGGPSVADSLDVLSGRVNGASSAIFGEWSIALVGMGTDTWDFGSPSRGYTANGGLDVHSNPVPIPPGCTLTQVRVLISPVPAHGANLPVQMPKLSAFTTDSFGNVVSLGGSPVTDSSASVAVYESPHYLTISGFSIPASGATCWFTLTSEGGLHAVSGTALVAAMATYTP